MSETIYIVFGSTGEYSDRQEWPVIAFMDEELAKKRVIDAEKRANEIRVKRNDRYDSIREINEFDAEMRTDYTGTSYFYSTVELVRT